MAAQREPKHFIVKHDLESFNALPGYIWNTRAPPPPARPPRGYGTVRTGDRWISFAYTTSEQRGRRLSQVTGFYECADGAAYREIPPGGLPAAWDGKKQAWMIEGNAYGQQPKWPVGVPPIKDLLSGKSVFHQQGIIPISIDDFVHIQKYTLEHQFNPEGIPVLQREPENEQELLTVVAGGYRDFGIERILRVRTAFPDLLVKIAGFSEEVHLELELYSTGFFAHGHDLNVAECRFTEDRKPVAVLCWIDDARDAKKHDFGCIQRRVYELRSLIRSRQQIVW